MNIINNKVIFVLSYKWHISFINFNIQQNLFHLRMVCNRSVRKTHKKELLLPDKNNPIPM